MQPRAPRRCRGASGRWAAPPYLGGGFGHFYVYAPMKIEYAIDRFAMEAKRQLDVLDKRLADNRYLAGDEIHHRRHRCVAVVRRARAGQGVRRRRVPAGTRVHARAPLGGRDRCASRREARPHGQSRDGRSDRAAARAPRRQRLPHEDAGQAGRNRPRSNRPEIAGYCGRGPARELLANSHAFSVAGQLPFRPPTTSWLASSVGLRAP